MLNISTWTYFPLQDGCANTWMMLTKTKVSSNWSTVICKNLHRLVWKIERTLLHTDRCGVQPLGERRLITAGVNGGCMRRLSNAGVNSRRDVSSLLVCTVDAWDVSQMLVWIVGETSLHSWCEWWVHETSFQSWCEEWMRRLFTTGVRDVSSLLV